MMSEHLREVKLGEWVVETNCPWVNLMASPKDVHDVDGTNGKHKRWVCSDKEDGVKTCTECLLGACAIILTEILDHQQRSNMGGIPLIQARK